MGAYRVLDDLFAVSFKLHYITVSYLIHKWESTERVSDLARATQLLSHRAAKSGQAHSSTHAHVTSAPLRLLVRGKGLLIFKQEFWKERWKVG